MKLPSVYILSHNGLGDNISMFSAIFFLSQYYDTVFFLCKNIYYSQVKYFFDHTDVNINIISFDSNNENKNCKNILMDKYFNSDIFICGVHKSYLSSKITHPELLSLNFDHDNKYRLPERFNFIEMFYNDMNLNLTIYIDQFHCIHNKEIYELYEKISKYKIIFLHTLSSINELNINNQMLPYLNDTNYLVICANKNFYDISNEKYLLANDYIFLQTVFHYYYLILNAEMMIMLRTLRRSVLCKF